MGKWEGVEEKRLREEKKKRKKNFLSVVLIFSISFTLLLFEKKLPPFYLSFFLAA